MLSESDSLTVSIKIGDTDAIGFSSSNNNSDFFNSLSAKSRLAVYKDEQISITIQINKTCVNNTIAVYSLSHFADYIDSFSFEQLIISISKKINNSGITFRTKGIQNSFFTTTIRFLPFEEETTPAFLDCDFRIKRLEAIQASTYSSHLSSYPLIAEDFIFKKAALVLFITSIYDITIIENSIVSFKLNGYKAIKGIFGYKDGNWELNYDQYLSIYEWIYQSGNLVDKIGLARNIISLHIETDSEIRIKKNTYQSILSSYKVYEKQNIRQYIEIRNKLSDQLLDFNKRANQIVDSFASGFQKTSLLLITFFSSVIAIKILGTSQISTLFAYYATILSFVFVVISILYLLIARWEVLEQKKRFILSYNNLKERCTDLLNRDDINSILNNDVENNADIEFISVKLRYYTILWVAVILLISMSVFIFFYISVRINMLLLIFNLFV